jgi:UDP-N-acetylglucosamine--N-acetylmuramyl-(pentapeptide) pyrophosphoryl-undecaprenol N-acetylglucosamine transferase
MKKNKIKIIFTGGHAGTVAIALFEEIKKRNNNWEIHWIGPKKSIVGKNVESLEYKYFEKVGIKFHSINFPKLQRKISLVNLLSFIYIPIGFIQAIYFLITINPDIVLSFGGFASFPVIVISKIFKKVIFIHEQTAVAGRANIISAKFADKILLSRETSTKYFNKSKTLLVGNPILPNYINGKSEPIKSNIKTILVIGGSRGSQVINEFIKKSLKKILEKYNVIHITGELDSDKFSKIKNNIGNNLSSNYSIHPLIEPHDMSDIYHRSDLVISRAGANTVSELISLGIPSIFIPIPWAYLDEQTKNAEYASKYINSIIVDQRSLREADILNVIEKLIANLDRHKIGSNIDNQASKKIIDLIEDTLK